MRSAGPRRWASRRASTCSNCTARTDICFRRLSRRYATAAATSTAARSKTGCAIRWKSFRAMRAVWPQERPMSVRISATDWVDGGISAEDSGRDRARVQGGRCRPYRRLDGSNLARRQTGLRTHVSNAVRRQNSQRGRYCDDGRREHHRYRSSERDSRGRPSRSWSRSDDRTSPIRSGRCTPRRSSATRPASGRRSIVPGEISSNVSSRERAPPRREPRRQTRPRHRWCARNRASPSR